MTTELVKCVWKQLTDIMIESLRFSDAEAERFKVSKIAKLVGILPFAAGCDDPERTALSHLATLVIASRGRARGAFDHRPEDDAEALARLRTISDFKGGDDGILKRGMALLCLCMVSGYERDLEKDSKFGEYNPIENGAWNAAEIKEGLFQILSEAPAPAVDEIVSLNDALTGYWEV